MTKHRWSEQDERIILETVSEYGPDRQRVAGVLNLPVGKVNNYIAGHLSDRYKSAVESYYARMRAQREVAPVLASNGNRNGKASKFSEVIAPVRPFEVEIPRPPKPKKSKGIKAVAFSDTHIRFHDEKALAVVESVIKDVRPDILLHGGDLLDAGMLSQKFAIDPARLETLQDDIDLARTKLHQWAQLAPQAERWLVCGNHEDRLTRLIWGLEGAARELPRLRIFQKQMSWPVFLGLDSIGWNWVPYEDQPRTDILPKLLVKHGDVVRKFGGWSAKGEWEKFGQSGISGHTHRANIWRHKDFNGQATWIETGCTCLYTTPGARNPDWQQAVTVIEWSADKTLMHAQQVLIRDGRAIWGAGEIAAA